MGKIVISLLLFAFCPIYSFAGEIIDYFDDFYSAYLDNRGICPSDRVILDELYKISNSKVKALEEIFCTSCSCEEINEVIKQIDEEYFDFLENINFEISLMPNCSLSKKCEKNFKRAHKKFLCRLSKGHF